MTLVFKIRMSRARCRFNMRTSRKHKTVTPGRARTRIVILLVATVAVLALPVGLWIFAAEQAVRLRSETDWQSNHRARVQLETSALIIAGLPSAGAVLGSVIGSLRSSPRTGVGAAAGALVGAVALVALLVGTILYSFAHMQLVF